ncbi:ATP-binding protein [Rhodospirillaceae bacterium SYSU D60014]|uniref:ATP-binding protein n=1 Tax=Virgifigura deserti TaxID=2268457 RepID=UPI000E6723CD
MLHSSPFGTPRTDGSGRHILTPIYCCEQSNLGFPSSSATKLKPFGQVESALSRKHGGTGLGLPLAKSLAEVHGGTLALESALGAGTTATVRFPKERVQAPGARRANS